jgi:hypothetical protein
MRGRRGTRIAKRPPEAANGGADFVDRKNVKKSALLRAPYDRRNWGAIRPRCVPEPHGIMGSQKEKNGSAASIPSLMPCSRSIRRGGIRRDFRPAWAIDWRGCF